MTHYARGRSIRHGGRSEGWFWLIFGRKTLTFLFSYRFGLLADNYLYFHTYSRFHRTFPQRSFVFIDIPASVVQKKERKHALYAMDRFRRYRPTPTRTNSSVVCPFPTACLARNV
jgi:hypothetical protein